jgi:hypothetical protein
MHITCTKSISFILIFTTLIVIIGFGVNTDMYGQSTSNPYAQQSNTNQIDELDDDAIKEM